MECAIVGLIVGGALQMQPLLLQLVHTADTDKTRLSCPDPVSNLQLFSLKYWGLLKTWKLETGSTQDKTVLSCLQLCSHCRHGQDKKRQLSCPCRRCEQAITVTSGICKFMADFEDAQRNFFGNCAAARIVLNTIDYWPLQCERWCLSNGRPKKLGRTTP